MSNKALAKLTAKQRQAVIVASDPTNPSYSETARRLGKSVQAVHETLNKPEVKRVLEQRIAEQADKSTGTVARLERIARSAAKKLETSLESESDPARLALALKTSMDGLKLGKDLGLGQTQVDAEHYQSHHRKLVAKAVKVGMYLQRRADRTRTRSD